VGPKLKLDARGSNKPREVVEEERKKKKSRGWTEKYVGVGVSGGEKLFSWPKLFCSSPLD